MGLTTDPDDLRLKGRLPNGQQQAYLVLSEEERAEGYVRPVRTSYRHVGLAGPQYPLRDLTTEEQQRYGCWGYVQFEEYPPEDGSAFGRFWKQEQLDAIGKGCGGVTTMNAAIAETYARNPGFYGATFCAVCGKHLPVGKTGEFVWEGTDERVGT